MIGHLVPARGSVSGRRPRENGHRAAPPAGVGEIDIGGTAGPIEIAVPMRGLRRWSPQAPNLYLAEIEATAGGQTLDRARLHFGMRALGVERGHVLMNKRPLWLRGSNLVYEWSWGGEFRDAKRYIVDEARQMNLNSFRTHTLPPPTHWANVADAHGMMLLAEFPVTHNYLDFEFTPEQRQQFHRNVLADATGWITKLWNHPSIVAWVISNEPRGDTDWEIGPYQQLVRTLDPTRLIVRTGDDLGTDDLVTIHPTLNYTNAHDGELALMARRAAANRSTARPRQYRVHELSRPARGDRHPSPWSPRSSRGRARIRGGGGRRHRGHAAARIRRDSPLHVRGMDSISR